MPRSKSYARHGLLDALTNAKEYLVKQVKGGTVIRPVFARKRKKPSVAQKCREQKFKEAVAHAKFIIKDPKRKAAYEKNLKGHRNAFQAALSDYMNDKHRLR